MWLWVAGGSGAWDAFGGCRSFGYVMYSPSMVSDFGFNERTTYLALHCFLQIYLAIVNPSVPALQTDPPPHTEIMRGKSCHWLQ